MNANLAIGAVLNDGSLVVSIDGDGMLIMVGSDGTFRVERRRIKLEDITRRDDARAVRLTNQAGAFARRRTVERIIRIADQMGWTDEQIVDVMRIHHFGNNWRNGIATPRTHRQIMNEVNRVRDGR